MTNTLDLRLKLKRLDDLLAEPQYGLITWQEMYVDCVNDLLTFFKGDTFKDEKKEEKRNDVRQVAVFDVTSEDSEARTALNLYLAQPDKEVLSIHTAACASKYATRHFITVVWRQRYADERH